MVPYLYKKGTDTPYSSTPHHSRRPHFCAYLPPNIGPARSNDGEDLSLSAQPLGGNGPVHLVIWTPMPILVEDG
jgi:hypothetical protein